MARRVQDYLASVSSAYELLAHAHSGCSRESAQSAHVPTAELAKAVVVKDAADFFLAVVPATRHVALSKLAKALHRRPLELATESDLLDLFPDCDAGALPPLGRLYGLPTIVDESIDELPEVYFEAGDHEHLVHMTQAEFHRLTSDAPRAHFSRAEASA